MTTQERIREVVEAVMNEPPSSSMCIGKVDPLVAELEKLFAELLACESK